MNNLFALLFGLSFIGLIVGIVKPDIISKLIRSEFTRIKVFLYFGVAFLVFFILFGATLPDPDSNQTITNNESNKTQQKANSWSRGKVDYEKINGFTFHTKNQDIYSYTLAGTKNISVTSMIKEGELIILGSHREKYNLDRKTEDISSVSVEYGFIPDELINDIQASKAYSSLAFDFKIEQTAFSGEITNNQPDKNKLIDTLKSYVSALKKATDTNQTKVGQQASSPSYKLLKEKKEAGGTVTPEIEFYLTQDRNYDQMYEFIKKRKVGEDMLYYAVFVDDEKYAIFSEYPITAMTFGEEQSKHIISTYWFNTANGNREFTYYEKNQWESVPKTRKD